jgi:hypothetical protein
MEQFHVVDDNDFVSFIDYSDDLDNQYAQGIHAYEQYITLVNGVELDRQFYDRIYGLTKARLPYLRRDRVYDVNTLLGSDIIGFLDDAECIFADMCLQHMAKRKILPLLSLIRGHNGPRIYILK